MPYNAAMKQRLMTGASNDHSPRLTRMGRVTMPTRRAMPTDYYNRGVNAFASTPGRHGRTKPMTVSNYFNQGVQESYGNVQRSHTELGDLFNDVMGAVVPGWAQRPQAMKDLRLNVDPAKVMQTAQNLLPASKVKSLAEQMNAAGLSAKYKGAPIGPNAIYLAYQAGGIGGALSAVPTWVWIAGAGGIGAVIFLMRK